MDDCLSVGECSAVGSYGLDVRLGKLVICGDAEVEPMRLVRYRVVCGLSMNSKELM